MLHDQVVNLRKEGLTYSEISKKLNISRSYAHRVFYNINSSQIVPTSKNRYFCFKCQKEFYSSLDYGDAICIKCGSEDICF